jgi:hypothetical protein
MTNRMTKRLSSDEIVESKFGAGEREQLPVASTPSHKGTKLFGKLMPIYRKIASPVRKHLKALSDA